MPLDPNRWTLRTQEAFNAAVESARAASNPEVLPDHLLVALLGQAEGVVLPVLEKVGSAPAQLRSAALERLDKLPKAYGGGVPPSPGPPSALDPPQNRRGEPPD